MKNEAESQAMFAVSCVRNVRGRAMLPDSTVIKKVNCCQILLRQIETRVVRVPIIRPNKNICAVRVTCQKKLGRVGREIIFFQELFLY